MGWAYYNEIDPFCVEWLRNLIKAGKIPDGEVDDRSIEDVKPSDLSGFQQCHFFAGLGGWGKVIKEVYQYDSVVWTGSCPCQPFSAAGKREGFTDERHLWPAFFHLIRECKPRFVFGEQVASPSGVDWFGLVQSDLEGEDYKVGGLDICAAGFGAPHNRPRIYWGATNSSDTLWDKQSWQEPCHGPVGRVGRTFKPFPWDIPWKSALRRLRAMDDGLSYGVVATDATRNAIAIPVAEEFVKVFLEVT